MKAVVCRVDRASVEVAGEIVGSVERGLLVYLGVMSGDGPAQAQWMTDKLAAMRLFNDDAGRINLSVKDVGGGILLIPNFTLAGETSRGTRPSFSRAAPPGEARPLFESVAAILAASGLHTATGVFGAHMLIDARFNGPVTVIVETASPINQSTG